MWNKNVALFGYMGVNWTDPRTFDLIYLKPPYFSHAQAYIVLF